MNVDKLDKMFHPGSVAVIGANEREGSIGAALMKSLMQGGYAGKILPVNPNCRRVFGMDACDSVMELGTGADLAVIATPIEIVPEIIRECGLAGVSGAVILSAGGRETGAAGHAVEEAIQREAGISGIRVMGPNCIGLVCGQSKLNASFAGQMPLPGRTAFISQSGSIYTAVLDLALREKIGFSHFVSLGSMSDVDFGDVIDYLGGDSQVGSILIYVESLNRFRNFMSAARSVARVKPIIAMKAGRSRAGIAAAASHTGAMSGEDAVYDAAFRRAGIVRVQTFEELFDCAELLAKASPPSGPRLTIITNAGGPGVIATDSIDHHGGEAARMSPEILEKLDAVLPSCWSRGNPVDILANASPERFRAAVEICLDAPESDGLLIILTPHALSRPSETAHAMAELLRGKKTPVVTSWMGGPAVAEGRDILNQAGIPTFDTPERAVRAFMDLYRRHRRVEMLQEIPPALPGNLVFEREKAKSLIQAGLARENGLLTETESKSLLAAYGIPVNRTEIARTPDEAWERACEMGGPVALKIFSTDISHKTDVGGVQLELETETDIRRAWDRIMSAVKTARPDARIDGVTVQPMLGTPGYELILGARKSPGFGPVILFGMGGVMTEIHRDHAIALPPLNRLLARRLMEGTRVWQLLQGFRRYPAADIALLEEILIRLSQLVTDFPEISELDINPLAVTPDGIQAADARVIVAPSDVPAPHHLVISPYPNQHEAHVTLRDDMPVFVRPIRPEDAPLLEEMFKTLSPRSVYYRFFAPLKSLRHSMLARFTQIDYDREIALVAISETGGSEQMLGVGRIIAERGGSEGEFAVTVGELWHGKGIGAELLQRCLDIALNRGMEKVWGIVLPENRNMLALGKKLGFKIRTDPESGDYLLSISFARPDEHTGG